MKKLHYWVVQLRRPLCFLVVLAIVAVWFCCTGAYAAPSGYTDFETHYGVDANTELPALKSDTMLQLYANDGYNSSNVTGTNAYIVNSFSTQQFNDYIVHNANYLFYDTISINGVNYNFADGHMLIGDNLNHVNYSNQRYIFTDGNVAIVNHWIVADAPIVIGYREFSNGAFGNFQQTYNIDTASDNGFYCWDINTYNGYGARFYDLDLFLSSSDGESGFTSFDLTSTDFSFSGNNYNFNYLKTGNYINVPSDPEPLPEDTYGDYVKSRMNFSMSSYYIGGKMLNNAKQHITIVWPEVVINNPENFYIYAEYNGKYQDESLASVITFNRQVMQHQGQVKKIPVSSLIRNGQLESSFDIDIPLSVLVDANDKSMYRYFLESVSAFSDSSIDSVINNNLWLQFLNDLGESISNLFGGSDAQPLAKLVDSIQAYITTMEIDGYIRLVYDNGTTNYQTGNNHTRFNFMTGDSSIVGTDNTINQYPAEGENPYQLPSNGSGSTVNTTNNNPVNVQVTVENVAREIFKPFILTDETVSTANVASNWNFMLEQLGDLNKENGFWAVIKETYNALPEGVTTMVYAAIAAILGCAVFRFYITCIRGA